MSRVYFKMIPKKGKIVGEPTNTFGEGGNYVPNIDSHKSDLITSLRGKATSGSDIRIAGPDNDVVRFKGRPISGDNVRTELAVGPMFDFGERLFLEYKFKVNTKNPIVGTAYLLQFWQPVISPIAGIRIENNQIQVVTRSSGSVYDTKFVEDKWYHFKMSFKAGDSGHFKLYNKKGNLLGKVQGAINGGSQAPNSQQDVWRPKFGFYGSSENSLNVDAKKFIISDIKTDIGL